MKRIISFIEKSREIQNKIENLEDKIKKLEEDECNLRVEELIDEYIENRFDGLCKKKYKKLGYQNTYSYFLKKDIIQTIVFIDNASFGRRYFNYSIYDFKDIVSIKDKKEAFEKLLSFEVTEN